MVYSDVSYAMTQGYSSQTQATGKEYESQRVNCCSEIASDVSHNQITSSCCVRSRPEDRGGRAEGELTEEA